MFVFWLWWNTFFPLFFNLKGIFYCIHFPDGWPCSHAEHAVYINYNHMAAVFTSDFADLAIKVIFLWVFFLKRALVTQPVGEIHFTFGAYAYLIWAVCPRFSTVGYSRVNCREKHAGWWIGARCWLIPKTTTIGQIYQETNSRRVRNSFISLSREIKIKCICSLTCLCTEHVGDVKPSQTHILYADELQRS